MKSRAAFRFISPVLGPIAFRRTGRHIGFCAVSLLAVPASGIPAEAAGGAWELANLSLEELMNETVTSVSKREEKQVDAASAVSVLTNKDLVRFGVVSIADALRMVPGVNVAAVNSADYAISIRGFNNVLANKLLVLVDGRSVYSPTYSGVYWDLQQPMLEDVDQIEVIRGPGATVWGANAVNGVINIVSRSARDTQGGLLYAGAGDVHAFISGARYGARIGENTYYRIFGSTRSDSHYPTDAQRPVRDGRERWHGGFRVDHYGEGDNLLTWQGDYTEVKAGVRLPDSFNANTLVRWKQRLDNGSQLQIQSYLDRTQRDDPERAKNTVDTFDFSAEHSFALNRTHEVIWGLGYRLTDNSFESTNPYAVVLENNFSQQMYNGFVQDEWTVLPERLSFTAGLKIEHNDYTAWELQPSLRATFKPVESQTVWAAVSRAVRTPSQLEGRNVFMAIMDQPAPGPGGMLYAPVLYGNPGLDAEVLWAYELGYRFQAGSSVRFDLALFYHDYEGITGITDAGPPFLGDSFVVLPLVWSNYFTADNYGAEISATWFATESLEVTGTYSVLVSKVDGDVGHIKADYYSESAPRHQASLAASYELTTPLRFDVQLRYMGEVLGVPDYLTADAQIAYQVNDAVELSIAGRNLFEEDHPEQADAPITINNDVPRGFHGKLTVRF